MGFVQLTIDGFSGALSGHAHCEGHGHGVYVRVSIRGPRGPLSDVVFSKHPTAELSTGLLAHACNPRPASSQEADAHLHDDEKEMFLGQPALRTPRTVDDSVEAEVQLINASILSDPEGPASGRGPSPALSPTDPVPRGLLTLCPGASSGSKASCSCGNIDLLTHTHTHAHTHTHLLGIGGVKVLRKQSPARDSDKDPVSRGAAAGHKGAGVGEVRGSWCSASAHEGAVDVGRGHLREGVCLSHVPVSTSSWLVLQVFSQQAPDSRAGSEDEAREPAPGTGTGGHSSVAPPRGLRQEAHALDVLIGWATFPLFETDADGGAAVPACRLKAGKFVVQLAAPPLDSQAPLASVMAYLFHVCT